jgi:hypothetical protein
VVSPVFSVVVTVFIVRVFTNLSFLSNQSPVHLVPSVVVAIGIIAIIIDE